MAALVSIVRVQSGKASRDGGWGRWGFCWLEGGVFIGIGLCACASNLMGALLARPRCAECLLSCGHVIEAFLYRQTA
jgi:hypothetical protein